MAAWRPTSYAELDPAVQAVVDRNAAREAERLGITVERARELIAARVTTSTHRTTHGTGH